MQFFVQIGLQMEPGDCPPLNINAMRAISVKSFLNNFYPVRVPPILVQSRLGSLGYLPQKIVPTANAIKGIKCPLLYVLVRKAIINTPWSQFALRRSAYKTQLVHIYVEILTSHAVKSQVYIPERRTLIQVLRLSMKIFCYLPIHIWAYLVYALAGGSTWMSVRLLGM